MATSDPASGIHMYLGSGGAPEGVLAAAALQSIGGQLQAKMLFRNDDEIARARRLGNEDLDRIYELPEPATGELILSNTRRSTQLGYRRDEASTVIVVE